MATNVQPKPPTPWRRKILLAFLILVIGGLNAANPVCALCQVGDTAPCFLNGQAGTKECVSNGWGPCVVETQPDPPVSGTVRPKYYILTVLYAPPGTEGGQSSSSVTYGKESTTGSTISAEGAFKQNYAVTISTGVGFLGAGKAGGEVGASFSYGRASTDSKALEIKKTTTNEISDTGPSSDGIDHDRDIIYLWLNPTINLSLSSSKAVWGLANTDLADIQYVYVGWLKDPSKMPAGVTQRLQTYGITPADYPEMLKADPFADGTTTIDPARFQRDSINTTFPYIPPYAPGEPVPTMKFTAVYSNTSTAASKVESEYSVGATASGDLSFIGLVDIKFKNENKWTWVNTNTDASSTGTSESASVTIGGPSYGYTGPTDMMVYYDVIYKTFMFAPIETTLRPALYGTVENTSGNDLAGKEVMVMANGKIYRTFTDAKGEYRIFGNLSGPLILRVDDVLKPLSQIPVAKRVDVLLP